MHAIQCPSSRLQQLKIHPDQHPLQHRVRLRLLEREVCAGGLDIIAELGYRAEAARELALLAGLNEVVDVAVDAPQILSHVSFDALQNVWQF